MKRFSITPIDVLLSGGVSLEDLEKQQIQNVMKEKAIPFDRNVKDLSPIGFELSEDMIDEVFQEINKLPKGWTRILGEGRQYFFRDEKKRNRIEVIFYPREGEYKAFAKVNSFYTLLTTQSSELWESKVITQDGEEILTSKDKNYNVAKEFAELLAIEKGIDLNNPYIGW